MNTAFSPRDITCPSCGATMGVRDRHGVEIDQCPRCRGVWLDRGELDRIIERSSRFLEVSGDDTGNGERGRDW